MLDEAPGEGGKSDDDGEKRRGPRRKEERIGRPFLDPRAPRRVEEIRSAPEVRPLS